MLSEETKILDLSGGNGTHIAKVLNDTEILPQNIFLADIDEKQLVEGRDLFGFRTVLLTESNVLDFPNRFFDIVFCNSVMEHVTIPKEEVWIVKSGQTCKARSVLHQMQFANEIRRISTGYWVQTPNKWFPIESHTFLPFTGYLPRQILILLLRFTNLVWVKQTNPDWNLLTKDQMSELFPDATILHERFGGLAKSIIAVKPFQGKG